MQWNLASLPSVPVTLAQQVQSALYAITPDSWEAKYGSYVRWQQTLSYAPLVDMLQRLGVMVDDGAGNLRCQTASELYDLVVCPAGSFKKSKADFDTGCADAGLDCTVKGKNHSTSCICKPCVYADEVEIIPVLHNKENDAISNQTKLAGAKRCSKMEVCVQGSQQRDSIPLLFKDNRRRPPTTSNVT